MRNTKALIEGAILISIMAIISPVIVYLPFLGMFFLFILPLPIILYTIRYGLQYGVWAGLVSLPVVFITSSFIGLSYACIAACIGVTMGLCYRKKQPEYAIVASSVVAVLCIVLFYVMSIVFFNMNVVDQVINLFQESFSITESMTKQMGVEDQVNEQMKQMQEQLEMFKNMIPTTIVITGVVFSVLSYAIAQPFVKRFSPDLPKMKPFREIRLPQSVVILYFIVTVLGFLPSEEGDVLYSVTLNAGIIFGIAICFQGLSFIFFYCHEKEMPKAISVLAVVLGLLIPFILSVYLLLGILDIGFNIRNKVTKKN